MATTKKTAKAGREVLDLCTSGEVKMVDLRFTDLPGTMQHTSVPATRMCEDLLNEGVGFDGSSIRGFAHINESDMLLMPDTSTAYVDPMLNVPTLAISCDVKDPVSGRRYDRGPRYIARKAEEYLKSTGIADTAFFGPELEFFVFDSVRYDQNQHYGFYYVDSEEGIWNSGNDNNGKNNLGHRPKNKEGYFPAPPVDTLMDFRSTAILNLMKIGIDCEVHHHEVATAGQGEIGMRYQNLTKMADQVMTYKYILKNTAKLLGKTVTFMPKPLFGDNGTGMHVHQSLSKDGTNVFYDKRGYALLSETAMHYIGGLLYHSPSLLALVSPSTNSFRRLVPGFEAPVNLVYSQRNRSAAVRIPVYSRSAGSKRLEYRPPDSTCNPYMAFSAMLMAGLDGIKHKIDPGEPMDVDLFELPKDQADCIKQVPGSLDKALDALEADHDYLTQGDVFTKEVIGTWLDYKRVKEWDAIRLRPHPYEFFLYFDA